ncbi:MAG: hypothetical protein Q9178_003761 [Gyalolechia marmorata]
MTSVNLRFGHLDISATPRPQPRVQSIFNSSPISLSRRLAQPSDQAALSIRATSYFKWDPELKQLLRYFNSSMDSRAAQDYLGTLLGKQLRIHTTDTRMFVGEFKCTDNECNVILSQSREYRHAPTKSVSATTTGGLSSIQEEDPMTGRFMGLIVVPGKHITKIELQDR